MLPGLAIWAVLAGDLAGSTAAIGSGTGEMVLDGKLDEPAWTRAPVHALMRQKQPNPGEEPSLHTTWQAVVVGKVLYVGVRCDKGEIPVVARRSRRDRVVESDRVIVDIDSRGRGQDAFHFEVTAGGGLVDGVRYNDTVLDLQWDGYWDAAVSHDDRGWTAEIEIPLRLLRRSASATRPVHIQIRRYITRLGELDEWARTPRDGSREVSRYGMVPGFEFPPRRATLDFVPYMSLGTIVQTPGGAVEPIRRLGANAKLQAGSDFALDATVLPDFGTVEADTAVFNLTPVEVQFPEKRPFFLEGTDVLATPLQLFYSRRIGSLSGTTAGTALEAPPPARVLAAGKALARAGKHWSFAGLAAVTEQVEVPVRDTTAGVVAPQRVSPTYGYGALRVRREIPHGGYVGFLGAFRASEPTPPSGPFATCPDGGDPVDGSCFADSFTIGPDFRARTPNGKWSFSSQVVGTLRHGGTPQAYPDGNEVESGDLGGAARALVEKTGGRVVGYLNYEYYGRDADWNATGFLPRPNHHFGRGHLALQTLTPHGPVFDDRWQLEVFQRFSLDGVPMGSGYQANYRARWKSFWWSFVEIHYRPGYFDNREARDGTPVEHAGLVGLEVELTSDSRRAVVAGLETTYQQRWNGLRGDATLNVDFNVLDAVQLRLGLNGTIDRGEPRWVETDDLLGLYRLARLDAQALGLIGRVNYTITNKLELQLYTQLLGVGTNYHDGFTAPVGVGRVRLDALTTDPGFDAVRSSEALWVMNLFLRWQYAPWSNLFLVVTRNQVDTENPGGGGRIDYGSVGRTAAAYTFMVKATMLLGW